MYRSLCSIKSKLCENIGNNKISNFIKMKSRNTFGGINI